MLPRRALQLLLHRVQFPRPQAAAFAAVAVARSSKATASSGGLALEAAVKKVQESAVAKFDETVDVAGARTQWHVCKCAQGSGAAPDRSDATSLPVNLNIDGTKSDQNVRGQVNCAHLPRASPKPLSPRRRFPALVTLSPRPQAVLPHSLGSNLRVLVFARGAAADAARAGNHHTLARCNRNSLT